MPGPRRSGPMGNLRIDVRRLGTAAGRIVAVLIVTAWSLALGPVGARASDSVRLQKTLPTGGPLYVDSIGRLLYEVMRGAPDVVRVLDLDSLNQKKAFEFPLPASSNGLTGYTGQHLAGMLAAVDEIHHKLYYAHRTDDASLAISAIDGTHLSAPPATFDLCSPEVSAACAPTIHYGIEALSYWPQGDKLYALYVSPFQSPTVATGQVARVFVQEIDPKTAKPTWSVEIRSCSSLPPDASAMVPFGRR